MTNWNHCF